MFKIKMTCLCSIAAFIAVMGFNVIPFARQLAPTAPPTPTMKTLDEIPPTWSQKLPAADRFELVLDGAAVLDKETGLVWELSPDTTVLEWNRALSNCIQKDVGGRKGWHLPTVEQLASLVDSTQSDPALPSGNPFSTNVQSSWYWSATTSETLTDRAWVVRFYYGGLGTLIKTEDNHVWCVRGAL